MKVQTLSLKKKIYTKTKSKTKTDKQTNKQMDRQNPRTNGKSKAIQTKSHKEAYPYILTKREKGGKYIYL